MSLIVDASVAVKWFLDEERSAAARELDRHELRAPDLILAETFNAVWKRWRRAEATTEQVPVIVPALRRAIAELVPLADLIEAAGELSIRHRHPIYDCCYLAAVEPGMTLVTADERQFAVARKARIHARLLKSPTNLAHIARA